MSILKSFIKLQLNCLPAGMKESLSRYYFNNCIIIAEMVWKYDDIDKSEKNNDFQGGLEGCLFYVLCRHHKILL